MSKWEIPGINIQWPWSEALISGKKTIETRGYRLPTKYTGIPLALIQTPGPAGKEVGVRRATIIGTIIFSHCFEYQTFADWHADEDRHLVPFDDAQFAFGAQPHKWGWVVTSVERFRTAYPAPTPRGIVFARKCAIPRPTRRDY